MGYSSPADAVGAKLYADGYNTVTVSVPAIAANSYHDNDISEITLTAGEPSDLFSVAENTKVRFSPGNLRATTSNNGESWTWSFATNQYDYIGNATANTSISGNGAVSTNGTVDLFGWSTSSTYYGINNSKNTVDYSGDFVDWGGLTIGDNPGPWRTLSSEEWYHLFYGRTNHANKYGSATVNDIHGIVLLPDNWTLPTGCSFNAGMHGWNNNVYDDDANAWTLMENNGAVFLPAAGLREGTSVNYVGDLGYCWSSTASGVDDAWFGIFGNAVDIIHESRYLGLSVRLVR